MGIAKGDATPSTKKNGDLLIEKHFVAAVTETTTVTLESSA
jgi:hypothetical protein